MAENRRISGARRGLRFKATFVAVASVALALLIMATASIIQSRRAIIAHDEQSAAAIASAFASAIAQQMTDGDEAAVRQAARTFLAGNIHVAFVAIYGSRENLITYQSQSSQDARQVGLPPSAQEGAIVRDHPIRATVGRSGADAPPIGRVVVGVSSGPNLAALREHSLVTLVMVLIGATLSIALILVTIRRWAHRIDQLAAATVRMSRGEFHGSLQDFGADEIGDLARAFEDMRETVRDRDAELRDLNQNLLEQVKERTRDLEESREKAENAREAAERASRAKSEFLANMSHELRTPLNGVVGMIELLRNTPLNEQQQRYVDVCRSSADSLLGLITDILDFSKIEAGRIELESYVFNLHSTVEDVAEMLAQNADRRGLELACYIDPGVPRMVGGDRDRIRQVLINIVNNAIKFTEKGEVVVRCEVSGVRCQGLGVRGQGLAGEPLHPYTPTPLHPYTPNPDGVRKVRFSVTDTGVGIPQDRMDRLFKSFSQVDSSTTRKYGGTGLGLAISKRLVEMMDGEINVESEVGKGSTFWFVVPFEVHEDRTSQTDAVPADLRGRRALIADDNATNRLILSSLLSNWGIEVLAAESSHEALRLLRLAARRGEPFELALLDMAMPHMDGLELAEAIHRDAKLQPIAMLMLTSFDEVLDAATRERLGIAFCLQKPARQGDLLKAISEAISTTIQPADESASPRRRRETSTPSDPKRTSPILIAEDNEANQLVASEIIRQAGYPFDIVETGHAAVEAVTMRRYGLVLMDCQMPEMDGFEATRRIRELEAAGELPGVDRGRLPIIALTANAIKGDRERCIQVGMDDYLAKPVEPRKLVELLRTYLSGSSDDDASDTPAQPRRSKPVKEPSMNPSDEPIDAESLLLRCVNKVEFVGRILEKFESEATAYLEELERSLSDEDADSSARAAHRMAGLAAVLSANDLQEVASKLETMARENRVDQLAPLHGELREHVQRCFKYIPTLREKLARRTDAE